MWNSRKKDYKLRVFNWLVTVLLLTFLFAISSSSNDNYQFNVQKDADDYTDITNGTDPNYKSEDSYNAEGMAGLYNLMDSVLKSMISEGFDLNEVITVDNGISINSDKLIDVVKQCSGLMAVLVILLLLLVFMPLVGIFFCCCRCCCGNCGGKPNVSPLKPSATKKMVYGVILILLTTGLLFCVVCTFGTNEQLNDNVRGLPKNLKNGVNDLVLFFDNTVKEMDNLLTVNFGEFKDKFASTMDDTQEDLKGSVSGLLNASSLTGLTDFFDNFGELETTANNLDTQSKTMKTNVKKLIHDTNSLSGEIQDTCRQISPICEGNIDFDNFKLPVTENMFPDMSEQVSAFEQLKDKVDDFNKTIGDGMETLNNINSTIDSNFTNIISTAGDKLDEAGNTISDNLKTVNNTVGDMKKSINDITDPLDEADEAIGNYFKYFWIVGVIISCVILMVLLCIVVGLIWGCCSPRPQQPSDQCCTKRGGGCFLICGTYTMFTLAVFMAVLALVMCILGVPVQRLVCDELEDPSNSKIFDLLDKTIDTSSIDLNFTLKSILNGCKNDKSLYNVFGLESQFNLTEITDKVNVNETIDSIDITGIFNSSFTIIDEDQLKSLSNMGTYSIALDLPQIDDLNTTVQNISFDVARESLIKLKIKLSDILPDQVAKIEEYIERLNKTEIEDLEPLKEEVNNFTITAENFSKQTMMGCSDCTDFKDVIDGIVQSINETQNNMQHNGAETIEKVTNTSLTNIKGLLNNYLDRVTDNVKDNIGKCGPINRVFNGITTSTCKKVFKPINGYWFGLFLALILFVPIIIFSVNLSILYQTTATSNYGNYNSNKKHKKSKRKHKARGYDSDAGQHYSSGQEYNGHEIVNMDRYADTSTRHRNHEGTTYF